MVFADRADPGRRPAARLEHLRRGAGGCCHCLAARVIACLEAAAAPAQLAAAELARDWFTSHLTPTPGPVS
jgi:hypothetical protein